MIAHRTVLRQSVVAVALATMFAVIVLGNLVELDPEVEFVGRELRTYGKPNASVTDLALQDPGNHGLYAAVGTHAPDATVVVSESAIHVNRLWFYGSGQASQVMSGEIPADRLTPIGEPIEAGVMRGRDWSLYLSTESPPMVFVSIQDAEIIVREVRDQQGESITGGTETKHRSILRDGVTDGLVAMLLGTLGALVFLKFEMPPLVRVASGFLVGLSGLAVVGMFRPSGFWPLPITAALLVVLATAGRQVDSRDSVRRIPLAFISSFLLFFIAVASRAVGFVWTSPDSFMYLSGAAAMSQGQLPIDLLDTKRMIGQQGIHAPLFDLGVEGFQSLGALVLTCSLIVLFQVVVAVSRPFGWYWPTILAVSVVLMLMTSQSVQLMAAYVNSHILVGGLLLLAAYLWQLRLDHREALRHFLPILGLILAALVLLRPEGILLVGVLLLAGIGTEIRPEERVSWTLLWLLPGLCGLMWNTLLIIGGGFQSAPVLFWCLSAGVLLGSLVKPPWPREVMINRLSLGLAWGLVWWVWLTARSDVSFFMAIRQNVFEGSGRWGMLGASLALLYAVVHVLVLPASSRKNRLLVWPIVFFLPILVVSKLGDGAHGVALSSSFLADMLGEGGGRAGWFDSVNRMWTHILFVTPALFVSALACLLCDLTISRRTRGFVFVGSIALVASLASIWRPTYVSSRWIEYGPYVVGALIVVAVGFALAGRPTDLDDSRVSTGSDGTRAPAS